MCEIKVIETEYKGYRFRSRLEARWAVFFDAIGLAYEYEPEGFDLGDGYYYLPDFYLPNQDVWVEIKGKQLSEDERQKIERFCQAKCDIEKTGTRFRLLEGQIPDVMQVSDGVPGIPCFSWITMREYAKVPGVNMQVAEDDPRGVLLLSLWKPDCSTQEMIDGLVKARQARFEHGEKPNQVFRKLDDKEHLEQENSRANGEEGLYRTERNLLAILSTGKLPYGMVKTSDFTDERMKALAEQLLSGKAPTQIIADAEDDDNRLFAKETFTFWISERERKDAVLLAQDCLRDLRIYHLQQEINALTQLMKTTESQEKRNQALLEVTAIAKELSRLKQQGR